MIHRQESGCFYAYCACGVCGPIRLTARHAKADDRAHATCCATGGRAA